MKSQDTSPYSDHDEIWALLPWYVNGSLEDDERVRVKAHVMVCLTCRKELAAQENLALALNHEPAVDLSVKPSFDRLMTRIREEEKPAKSARRSSFGFDLSWTERLDRWVRGLNPQRLSLAMACLAAAVALPLLWQPDHQADSPAFHTVANAGSFDAYTRRDLKILFAPGAVQEDIDRVLGSIHGNVLEGPSDRGLYTVRVEDEAYAKSGAEFLQRLRADKAVAFVEPALPPSNR